MGETLKMDESHTNNLPTGRSYIKDPKWYDQWFQNH